LICGIRIFVEGGGKGAELRKLFRNGFSAFLCSIRDEARRHRLHFDIIPCGPRSETIKRFAQALNDDPRTFNALLVDADAQPTGSPREHLSQSNAKRLSDATGNACHLMVELMESWLIADPDALGEFYGKGFRNSGLPRSKNLEQVAKSDVLAALKHATTDTGKGEYHKTQHGPQLLTCIAPAKVRQRAPHCERLFTTLAGVIETHRGT
jgi:hypothetical protein